MTPLNPSNPQGDSGANSPADVNLSRMSEMLSQALCVALTPHLPRLATPLALRASLHQDNVRTRGWRNKECPRAYSPTVVLSSRELEL